MLKIHKNQSLAGFTTFKTGGPADYFARVRDVEELLEAVNISKKMKIPFLVIGGGSNILVGDHGFRGMVIKNEMNKISLMGAKGSYGKKNRFDQKVYLKVDSGVFMNRLVRYSLDNSYQGLENFLGQPGTVGGAIYINAHNMKKDDFFGDHIKEAEIIEKNGERALIDKKYFRFTYDNSKIQKNGDIIVSIVVELKKKSGKEMKNIWKLASEAVNTRQESQPYGFPSAGCVFKNISKLDALRIGTPNNTTSAGYLIDSCKFKDKRISDALISPKHANFIINLGSAKSADVLKLINLVKKKVWQKYKVHLEEEIVKLGEF